MQHLLISKTFKHAKPVSVTLFLCQTRALSCYMQITTMTATSTKQNKKDIPH